MKKTEYFDYLRVAKTAHIPQSVLREIETEARKGFRSDRMMYELHVLRAIKSGFWQKQKKAA